jgi:hypothetical protein
MSGITLYTFYCTSTTNYPPYELQDLEEMGGLLSSTDTDSYATGGIRTGRVFLARHKLD